jgi:hypothetical protein
MYHRSDPEVRQKARKSVYVIVDQLYRSSKHPLAGRLSKWMTLHVFINRRRGIRDV